MTDSQEYPQGIDTDGPQPGPADQPSDANLISAVRAGNDEQRQAAFGELYRRHAAAATRLARMFSPDRADADDLVAEAFARILAALRSGAGPELAFRPYLLAAVRNLSRDAARRTRRVEVTDDVAAHDPGVPFVDPALEDLERSMVARAFIRLPERWRLVLWHTAVEGEAPSVVARLLGVTPNAVSALAYRAREALRQQYLQQHIEVRTDGECRWAAERLGAHARGGLSRGNRQRLDAHLGQCRPCHVLWVELAEVNAGLGAILAPVLVGGAVGYGSAGAASGTAFGRLVRRRGVQAATAVAVVAGLVVLAMVLLSAPAAPPAAQVDATRAPTAGGPAAPTGSTRASSGPSASAPSRTTGGGPGPSIVDESGNPVPPAELTSRLEPVGALVRGRPGVLALTVTNPPAANPFVAPANRFPASAHRATTVEHGLPVTAPEHGLAASAGRRGDSGPVTARVLVPNGVTLRSADAGDGWSCATVGEGIDCELATLPAGATTRAFVLVDVSLTASLGPVSVAVSGPAVRSSGTSATRGVTEDGLAAVLAMTAPSTVVVGGNSLLSCPPEANGCDGARTGVELTGRVDNGDYTMVGYTDPRAPQGYPAGAAVSGAAITLPGRVVWAGLYWAGSGDAPAKPTAHLRSPASGAYVPVAAARVDRVSTTQFGQAAYQAFADVTDLVGAGADLVGTGADGATRSTTGAAADGQWYVAVTADQFHLGANAFGGWALMAIVDDGGPVRTIAVFDGCTALQGTQTFSAGVYGSANGPARIGFIAWEGDRGISGDQIRLGRTALGGADADNLMRSGADGTLAGWNTFGVDARVLDGQLPGVADEQTITAATSGDAWLLGAIAVITPL